MSAKKGIITRISAAVLSAALVFSALGITAAADETASNVKRRQQTLYTVGNTAYENACGTNKGNRHDCQHLGVWVPEGVTFKIRQVNTKFGQDLTFRMRTDDGKTESVHTLSKNGDWTEVTPAVDSVPFVSSVYSANGQKPVVEFTVEGTKELPVYEFGDDEEAFFKKWDELDAPYAVYLSEKYAIFLVPARDKENNRIGSLDDLLLWYDNMVAQYNAFSGLSLDADEEWNRDSGTRFFIKANKNGAGAAYYSIVETAPNSDSLLGYMEETNWGPLHEVGHGYDTVNFGSAEIWNNVLAHYYQISAFGKGTWLKLDDTKRAHYESQRDSVGYWGSDEYDTKLYFWVNMLDKLGAQETSAYAYRLYRGNKANGIENLSGHSFYADAYTKASGYNVTAWFDMWGFDIADSVREELIEDNCYQNVYPLRNLVSSDSAAEKIAAALNLDSTYSLVETQELINYQSREKITGSLTVKLDELTYNSIKGKKILITDGEHTAKEFEVTSKSMTVELPIGLYNVILPGAAGNDAIIIDNRVGYAAIEQDSVTTYSATAETVSGSGEYVNWQILFNSNYTYNGTFCSAETDIANNELHITAKSCDPHTYISMFAYIRVCDKAGNEVYLKECPGTGTTAVDKTVHIEPGYTIEIFQAEPARGHYVQSSAVKSQKLVEFIAGKEYSNPNTTCKFKVTKYGLECVTPNEVSGEENYYRVLCAEMDGLKEKYAKADFRNEDKFPTEKAKITAATELLSDEYVKKFTAKYSGYYPFNQGVYTLTVDPIATQDYTGNEVKPQLTVHSGSILLSGSSYETVWLSNVKTGTAKVKVYGNGKYANHCGEASFEIALSKELPAVFSVTSDVKAYEYSGGAKRPTATVTLGDRVLTRNVDYILSYSDNTELGIAKVTAVGMGCYKGISGYDTFSIVEKGKLPSDEEIAETEFTDVKAADYFFEPVKWAIDNKITNGMGNGLFGPMLSCTRADAVTFIWRSKGSPEPKSSVNPFTDVKEGQYYYKAVLWAVENGITTGTGENLFSPRKTVNRAEMVTFLFRSEITEEITAGKSFDDVKADDYFADSVAWAVNKGITNGMGNNKFMPAEDCTRAQIVTMLYRNLPDTEGH